MYLAALLLGCNEETARDEPDGAPKSDVREGGGLDPKPEKSDGSESEEFEPEDLEAAADAGRLIEIYCEGAQSEAQFEGCLSHVSPVDVCFQDTEAKRAAVVAYIAETENEGVCD